MRTERPDAAEGGTPLDSDSPWLLSHRHLGSAEYFHRSGNWALQA